MPSSLADYIDAVVAALAGDDTRVLAHRADADTVPRTATIDLDTAQDDIAFTDLDALTLTWHEETGWEIGITYEPGVGLAPPPIYRGISVLPTPEVVAAWVGSVITHPEVIASRADGRLRTAGDTAPDFATALAP
ncbi:DUF6292 family protein [Saccharopolyspora hattusasensis]|uniref:DUF6292 family protein n=1 Tax=Saccharopolyspora hattusasensis TaxID=1128679 RepID=UPI003D97D4C9